MLRLEHAYWLLAAFLVGVAWVSAREKRYAAAAFWGGLAALTASGQAILDARDAGVHWPGQLAGLGVVALAMLAPQMGRASAAEAPKAERESAATRLGHWLFVPALLVPVVTVAIALFGAELVIGGQHVFDGASLTLVGLAVASVVALLSALRVTRAPPRAALEEGRRLLDTIGWAALLPMLLATLGGVFSATGVGDAIASLTSAAIPETSRLACVLAYGLGMVVFTMIMGNAFAAFPVMTAGVGLPLLILRHHADPAVVGALGMLTGYCGTLMTPMAANFNVVPAALLELRDPHAVIRAQVPTALVLLAANLVLMDWLAFP
jgi:uncharacterized membrane protein